VLKGEYTTITLAVYGILTKNVTEPILESVEPPLISTHIEEQIVIQKTVPLINNPLLQHESWPNQLACPSPILVQTTLIDATVAKVAFPLQAHIFEEYYDVPIDPRGEARQTRSVSPRDKSDQRSQEILDLKSERSRRSISPLSRNHPYERSRSRSREYERRNKCDWSRSPGPADYRLRSRRQTLSEREDHHSSQRKRPHTPDESPIHRRPPRSPPLLEPDASLNACDEDR
jgi:protein virilizer